MVDNEDRIVRFNQHYKNIEKVADVEEMQNSHSKKPILSYLHNMSKSNMPPHKIAFVKHTRFIEKEDETDEI